MSYEREMYNMCERLCNNRCGNNNCTKADEKFKTDLYCGLTHQQFKLRAIVNNTEHNPLYVYRGTRFPVYDINGIPQDPVFPSGTVIARNLSGKGTVRYIVYGDPELEEVTSLVVPPNSEVAITASSISSVVALTTYPQDPTILLFLFDIMIPSNPYASVDPI